VRPKGTWTTRRARSGRVRWRTLVSKNEFEVYTCRSYVIIVQNKMDRFHKILWTLLSIRFIVARLFCISIYGKKVAQGEHEDRSEGRTRLASRWSATGRAEQLPHQVSTPHQIETCISMSKIHTWKSFGQFRPRYTASLPSRSADFTQPRA
jgi:hypothetical protein